MALNDDSSVDNRRLLLFASVAVAVAVSTRSSIIQFKYIVTQITSQKKIVFKRLLEATATLSPKKFNLRCMPMRKSVIMSLT